MLTETTSHDGTTDPRPLQFPTEQLCVVAWPDPVIDELGHDPRSAYVEHFWLSILGPSTVWLLRRLADGLEREPEGFVIDLADTARALGVGMRGGRQSPFMRSLERVCRFGAARWQSPTELAVRRRLPPLTRAQIERLPLPLQAEHRHWTESRPAHPDPRLLRERADQLARTLLELGEDPASTERQLHRWRFHPAMAHAAVQLAVDELAAT
ncbi:MAG TPA: hypothetical protein VMT43_05305 [Acidimicrobiales bacterium]|nr:hypothetical protein [Acidimicrobiales bacterium]